MIERQSGRIAYVVMSFGGFLDFGQETYTVPWAKLSYDVGLGGYRTDITENELRDAPRFAHAAENASLRKLRRKNCTQHFRIRPHWRGGPGLVAELDRRSCSGQRISSARGRDFGESGPVEPPEFSSVIASACIRTDHVHAKPSVAPPRTSGQGE